MISRPTLSCSHWWEFLYTECCHDVILRVNITNVQGCNVLFKAVTMPTDFKLLPQYRCNNILQLIIFNLFCFQFK